MQAGTRSSSYAELPGLRSSENAELRAELLRLVDERATPSLLAVRKVPPERNAAVGLREVFGQRSELYEAAESVREVVESGVPLSGTALERGQRVLQRYAHQRSLARVALERPECDLEIDAAEGFMADLSAVDTLRLFSRLEACAASQFLAQDRPGSALEPIRYMFRYAECLAAEPHVVARLEGAFARREALAMVEATTRHPMSDDGQRVTLYQIVLRSLGDWPPDAWAWMGDRAQGMHTYEVVRAGHINKLLTADEEEQLRSENWLSALRSPTAKAMDADEWHYLSTMRRLIDACDQPFYQRRELFETMARELQARRNDEDFPVVAARLLLNDVRTGQEHQARDRAACEAWALALAAAVGNELPPFQINPLTGTEYQVMPEEGRVLVWPVGTDEPSDFQAIELPRVESEP